MQKLYASLCFAMIYLYIRPCYPVLRECARVMVNTLKCSFRIAVQVPRWYCHIHRLIFVQPIADRAAIIPIHNRRHEGSSIYSKSQNAQPVDSIIKTTTGQQLIRPGVCCYTAESGYYNTVNEFLQNTHIVQAVSPSDHSSSAEVRYMYIVGCLLCVQIWSMTCVICMRYAKSCYPGLRHKRASL